MDYNKVIEYRSSRSQIKASQCYINDLNRMYEDTKDTSLLRLIEAEEKHCEDLIYRRDKLSFEFLDILKNTDERIIKHCIMRYVLLGQSWQQVADSWGDPNGADALRIRFRRFIDTVELTIKMI